MATQETRSELTLTAGEAAKFFHRLAAALEKGDERALDEFGIHIEDSEKITLGIRRRLDAITLKIKVKGGKDDDGGEEDVTSGNGRRGSMGLKKRMGRLIRSMGETIATGCLPLAEDAGEFLELSARLTTFPGSGHEPCASYTEACDQFAAAIAAGDTTMVGAAFGRLADHFDGWTDPRIVAGGENRWDRKGDDMPAAPNAFCMRSQGTPDPRKRPVRYTPLMRTGR
ncbi:MAG: GAK system XXXCH domain-containing protein [Thermodesulfobacteriota bacterium]